MLAQEEIRATSLEALSSLKYIAVAWLSGRD